MKILLIVILLLPQSFAKSDKYSCSTEITNLTARLGTLYVNFQFTQIFASITNIISIWEKLMEIQENCPASEFNEFLIEKSNLFLNLIQVTYNASLIHFDDLKGYTHEQLSELQEKLKNILFSIPGIIGGIASKIPEFMNQAYSYTVEMTPECMKQAYSYTKEKAPEYINQAYSYTKEKVPEYMNQAYSYTKEKAPEYMNQAYSYTKEKVPEYMNQAYSYTQETAPIVYDFVEQKVSDVLSSIYNLF